MSPQQTAMIETLKRRKISNVVIKPFNAFEASVADATLTKTNGKAGFSFGEYSATLDQLQKYYEAQHASA